MALRERTSRALSEPKKGDLCLHGASIVVEDDMLAPSTGRQRRRVDSACNYNNIAGNREGLEQPMDGKEAPKGELPSHHA